jgi:ATP-dependent RNA helicase SUPV3L1/SUV3
MCGDAIVVDLITSLCEYLKCELKIQHYKRLNPLLISGSPLRGINDIQCGDAIISFSRRKLFNLKKIFEKELNLKCHVVYGRLPPKTRLKEAIEFNKGNSVLLATDAVGMGLNLSINRVVFYDVSKFDGKSEISIPNSHLKQIGGRAGRFSVDKPEQNPGIVTALRQKELKYVQNNIKVPSETTGKAEVSLSFDNLTYFGENFPGEPLYNIMKFNYQLMKFDLPVLFNCSENEDIFKLANLLDEYNIPLRKKIFLLKTPVTIRY